MKETQRITKKVLAPELQVSGWLNAPRSLTLTSLRGKVVVMYAFQMFCPGCVQYSIPQMQRIFDECDSTQVAVIGIHTVFEHHAAMDQNALEAFVHEHKLRFPIAIDKPDVERVIPHTMRAYHMQGTPTIILIDKMGYLRLHKFGHVSDFILGVSIGKLLAEEVENT